MYTTTLTEGLGFSHRDITINSHVVKYGCRVIQLLKGSHFTDGDLSNNHVYQVVTIHFIHTLSNPRWTKTTIQYQHLIHLNMFRRKGHGTVLLQRYMYSYHNCTWTTTCFYTDSSLSLQVTTVPIAQGRWKGEGGHAPCHFVCVAPHFWNRSDGSAVSLHVQVWACFVVAGENAGS